MLFSAGLTNITISKVCLIGEWSINCSTYTFYALGRDINSKIFINTHKYISLLPQKLGLCPSSLEPKEQSDKISNEVLGL